MIRTLIYTRKVREALGAHTQIQAAQTDNGAGPREVRGDTVLSLLFHALHLLHTVATNRIYVSLIAVLYTLTLLLYERGGDGGRRGMHGLGEGRLSGVLLL